MSKFLNVLLLVLFFNFSGNAQDLFKGFEHLFSTPRDYVVYRTISEIKIDGKPDEASWQHAPWTDFFRDIEGENKPLPKFQTRAKMIWNEQNLYILAELEEPHVWAYYDQHDQIVFHENDFEVFIDPTRDTHNYFEFEVNAQNTLFDLFLPKPYRNGGGADIPWNAIGFQSAVWVDGTLNDPSDTDKGWTVEMSIPFAALKSDSHAGSAPLDGQLWKMNFSRVQWQTEIVDGKYHKMKDPVTNNYLNEDNWVWSQQGLIDMHYPERWGLVLFSENKVNGEKVSFQLPKEEKWAKYLWLAYYKQHEFKRENGKFATLLSELQLNKTIETEDGKTWQLRMEARDEKFTVFMEDEKGNERIVIDQEGLIKWNK